MTAVVQTWPEAGELVRRVTIRGWTDTPGPDFGIVQQFDAGVTVWAKILPVRGAANWNGQQIGEDVTHLIWVRYIPGKTTPTEITPQKVIDLPIFLQRFRVLRSLNVGDAQRYTQIECKLLGPIP